MSVKLGRYVIRMINGRPVPIRIGSVNKMDQIRNSIPKLAEPQKIKEFFSVGKNPLADFFLQRKGSEKTVGSIRSGFPNEDIGVKVKDYNQINPKFAEYAFMNLYNQGFWKNYAKGSLNLKNLRSTDVKNTSIEELFPSMKKQRIQHEEALKRIPTGISSKALKKFIKDRK